MIEVYGTSDDLIEVEGDITEEFTDNGENQGQLLAFSNGVVLRIRYSAQGIWRITQAAPTLAGSVIITQAPEGDESNYSDRARIEGEVTWVVLGSEIARSRSAQITRT